MPSKGATSVRVVVEILFAPRPLHSPCFLSPKPQTLLHLVNLEKDTLTPSQSHPRMAALTPLCFTIYLLP